MNLLAIKIGAVCVISLVHDYLEKRADNSTTLVLTFFGRFGIVLAMPNFYLQVSRVMYITVLGGGPR